VKGHSAPGGKLWNSLPTAPTSYYKKRLVDRRIATDPDMEQAVKSSLETPNKNLFYAGI